MAGSGLSLFLLQESGLVKIVKGDIELGGGRLGLEVGFEDEDVKTPAFDIEGGFDDWDSTGRRAVAQGSAGKSEVFGV